MRVRSRPCSSTRKSPRPRLAIESSPRRRAGPPQRSARRRNGRSGQRYVAHAFLLHLLAHDACIMSRAGADEERGGRDAEGAGAPDVRRSPLPRSQRNATLEADRFHGEVNAVSVATMPPASSTLSRLTIAPIVPPFPCHREDPPRSLPIPSNLSLHPPYSQKTISLQVLAPEVLPHSSPMGSSPSARLMRLLRLSQMRQMTPAPTKASCPRWATS